MANSVYKGIEKSIGSIARCLFSSWVGGKLFSFVGLFLIGILAVCPWTLAGGTAEYITGRLSASSILEDRIYFVPEDQAFTNLGMKDGLIKGDILQISQSGDQSLTNPAGQCALVKVEPDYSVCEIISVKHEISQDYRVYTPKLYYSEERLYPIIYSLLYKTVEPYAPQKRVSVYIHDIFDKRLNLTAFSVRAKREVENIFSQKSKIILKQSQQPKEFHFYPIDSAEYQKIVNDFMKKESIDVLITALYSLEEGQVNITFYKYDRHFGKEVLPFQVKAELETDTQEMKKVIASYKAPEKQEIVTFNISCNELSHSAAKFAKVEIVRHEAEGDAFKENDLRAREFNIIAPSDITVFLDDEKVKLGSRGTSSVLLTKGTHRLAVEFKRGYFFNTKGSLVYASKKLIKKDAILVVKNPGDINVSIDIDPSFVPENIKVNVYRERIDARPQIKVIKSIKTDSVVETFVD